jgi:hypothetical protein
MGAVPVEIIGIVVVADEVPAAHVVDEPVVVVVGAVDGLVRIGPDVGGEVGMLVSDAGVDDRDDHRRAAGRQLPGLGGVDVRVSGPGGALHGLALVVKPPLQPELGIVRDRGHPQAAVGLHVADVVTPLERFATAARRHRDELEAGKRQLRQARCVLGPDRLRPLGEAEVAIEGDDQPAAIGCRLAERRRRSGKREDGRHRNQAQAQFPHPALHHARSLRVPAATDATATPARVAS